VQGSSVISYTYMLIIIIVIVIVIISYHDVFIAPARRDRVLHSSTRA